MWIRQTCLHSGISGPVAALGTPDATQVPNMLATTAGTPAVAVAVAAAEAGSQAAGVPCSLGTTMTMMITLTLVTMAVGGLWID